MRPNASPQQRLFLPAAAHSFAKELAETDALLRLHPEWEAWILEDLTSGRGVQRDRGRRGMPPARLLRLLLLKHRLDVSVHKLAKLIDDSLGFREFLGLGLEDLAPKRSAIQDNLARVRPETWGRILRSLLQSPELRAFESGRRARVDSTVVEANVRRPSDSALLWDSVRTLTRLMKRAHDAFPQVSFDDRSKRAKKLHSKLFWTGKKDERRPAYEALLAQARSLSTEVLRVMADLERVRPGSPLAFAVRDGLVVELGHYRSLMERVIDQAERRVIRGETVPAHEKVFSIFEPHTDMIVKSRSQPPEFGHKVTLTVGEHFVLDCVIERGNPGDVTLALRQVERMKALFGQAPEQVAFDGAYASAENLRQIKALGVDRCAFSKGRGLTPEEMAGSRRTYGRLRNFRAGIEGKISWLKRDFGLDRCTWKGWGRFQAYVWSAILAANLSKLARLRLATQTSAIKRAA